MLIDRRLFIVGLTSVMGAAAPAFAQTLGEVETRANVEYGRHDGEALLGDLWAPKAPGKYPAVVAVHGGAGRAARKAPIASGAPGSPSAAMWSSPSTTGW